MRMLMLAAGSALSLLAVGACSSGAPMVPTQAPEEAASTPATPPMAAPADVPQTARYRVTFLSTWSPATHPREFPANAHFSPLVGGTHQASASFWTEGALATIGIQDMAERGLTFRLEDEINGAMAAGRAARAFRGGAIDTTPGSVTLDFEMDRDFPLVTLVSMIAPSPDWFVGVSALPLFENGQWIDTRRHDLVPWDAGTDSGTSFRSADLVTAPKQPIARILTAPLSPGGQVTPLGSFTFTRIS